ncbi:uncharacterized protein LOC131680321 [Topomyia yanbarensis]|uniref:uncharacterized protein LOC131680321 n=1 Tax=Topomyia yanbarensis TaxID=2498891 RepID=UPI00273C9914|nr:uncharacterized protein LOC131680321 [Topomyia yanbarensis]
MWFTQAEVQFALAGIQNDQTKFFHILAKVDQLVLRHISDLVAQPPEENKYKAIKDRLISRFELSAQEKLEKLLSSCDLDDMRPTHLLAKMQELSAGFNANEELLKMLFLQRMPPSFKAVLSISDGSIAKLAEMADKMGDSSGPHQVAAASYPATPGSLQDLEAQIAALSAEVRRLKTNPAGSPNRSRSSSRQQDVPQKVRCSAMPLAVSFFKYKKLDTLLPQTAEVGALCIMQPSNSFR